MSIAAWSAGVMGLGVSSDKVSSQSRETMSVPGREPRLL
jgi:hypothetical protein